MTFKKIVPPVPTKHLSCILNQLRISRSSSLTPNLIMYLKKKPEEHLQYTSNIIRNKPYLQFNCEIIPFVFVLALPQSIKIIQF